MQGRYLALGEEQTFTQISLLSSHIISYKWILPAALRGFCSIYQGQYERKEREREEEKPAELTVSFTLVRSRKQFVQPEEVNSA